VRLLADCENAGAAISRIARQASTTEAKFLRVSWNIE
jgi:hypothetical protein